MRRALLAAGSAAAALLLALGASACGSPGGAAHPSARREAAATARRRSTALATSASSPRALTSSPALVTTTLTWLAMRSPEHGYGMFERKAGGRCEAESGVTTDGGARFRNAATITTWNCNNNAPVTKIAADSAGAAFAYGPKLFIAPGPDGPWRASPQRGTVLAVSAVGRSVWQLRAVCRNPASTIDGCVLRLEASANGGRSWRAAPAPPGAVTLGSQDQSWLVRTGKYSAYVAATPALNNRGKRDSAAVWYTGNGGRAWSKRRLPCGIDAVYDALAVAPGGTLAAVCAEEPSAGFQAKTAATSADGGRTWTLHTGCLFRPGCRDPLYDGYLGEITAVSQDRIYLVGDRSSLLVTSDGGVRWHAVQPVVGDTSGGTGQVIFFGVDHGLVTGQSGSTEEGTDIFRTSNGGRTWKRIVPRLS